MRCQVCGMTGQEEGDVCTYCGARVCSVLGKGRPLPTEVAREFEEKKRKREADHAETRKSRLKRHAVAGAFVFCAIGLVLFLAQTFLTWAAATRGVVDLGSLVTRLLVAFLLIPVYAAALGVPMGVLVSKWRLGLVAAGLAGAVVFFASYFLLGMRFMVGPVQTPITVFLLAPLGFIYGAILSISVGIDSEG